MKDNLYTGPNMLADLVATTRVRKHRKRTLAANKRRNELESARRREMIGNDLMKPKRFWHFGQAMASEDAIARSRRLDQGIREGANLIRPMER